MKEPRSTEGFAKDTNSPKKTNPEKNLHTFAKCSILIRLPLPAVKYIAHALPRKTKVGTAPTAGQYKDRKSEKGTAARTVLEVAKSIFNSGVFIISKERNIIFHIKENEHGISVETEVNLSDAIIIIDTLFKTLEQKGIIEIEKTKKEIEG